MIPVNLMTKLQSAFSPLLMRLYGVRDVLVREDPPNALSIRPPRTFSLLVIIDDEHFAATSAVVPDVFHLFFEREAADASLTLRMRPSHLDSLSRALGMGAEWYRCIRPGTGGAHGA